MTHQEIILQAMRDARAILDDYVDPRPHDCVDALNRLLRVRDRDEVIAPRTILIGAERFG